jgi:predicted DCC family thiol-disulfide oxidoreductase YuxK
MKVELLRLNTVNKSSPISEGVTEIRINSQPCKGINLTKQHTQARRDPRVVTVHDAVKESGRVLPRSNAIFHTYALTDTPWVARTLSHCTPMKWGKVSSNSSTHEATQFWDPICPVCVSIFQMLVQHGSTDAGLNRHRRGLSPWSSKFMIETTLNLPIQYSPFSPNCPARSCIKSFYQLIMFSTFQHEPGYKRP